MNVDSRPKDYRRRRRSFLLLSSLVLLAACLSAPPAGAATYFHPFLEEFGPNGTSSSTFAIPGGVAVDQETHDVYVEVPGRTIESARLYRFNSDGQPAPFTAGPSAGSAFIRGLTVFPAGTERSGQNGHTALAVAPPGAPAGTGGDIYIAEPNTVKIFSSTGESLGSLNDSGNHNADGGTGTPCGLTTDPAGDLYVAYAEHPEVEGIRVTHIDKYVPSANPPVGSDFDSELTPAPEQPDLLSCYLAAASSQLYSNSTTRYGAYEFPSSLFPGGGASQEVSSADVIDPGPNGATLVQGQSTPGEPGVDPSNQQIYIGGFPQEPPAPPWQQVIGSEVVAQYDSEGNRLSILEAPVGTTNESGSLAVDGGNGQVYDFLGFGESPSKVQVFGPGVIVNPAEAGQLQVSELTYKSAHFSGTVNSGGSAEYQATWYHFACTPGCPGLPGEQPISTDGQDHEVSAEVTGLEPETEYTVRLVAENRAGPVERTLTFTTPPPPPIPPPVVANLEVSNVTGDGAHFAGTVNSGGSGALEETEYRFACSPDCPGIESFQPLTSDGTDHTVEADATDLWAVQPYTVKLIARDAAGLQAEAGAHFETLLVPPAATSEPAQDIATTHASLQGMVKPHHLAATYWFEYGPTTLYGTSAPSTHAPLEFGLERLPDGSGVFQKAGSDPNGSNRVAVPIYGLTPDTTYHYRLVASGEGGVAYGADRTFNTASAAPVENCPNAVRREEQHASYLPNCRAFEMVSPQNKNGGYIIPMSHRTKAAAAETPGLPMAVAFASLVAFGDSHGTGISSDYMSQRTAVPGTQGWSTHALTPPQQPQSVIQINGGISDAHYSSFSEDLTQGVFRSLSPLTDAPNVAETPNLYTRTDLRASGVGTYTLDTPSASPIGPSFDVPWLAGASADFSHLAIQSFKSLTPEVPACSPGKSGEGCPPYAYESVDGSLRLAGLVPLSGETSCEGGVPACEVASSVPGNGVIAGGEESAAAESFTPHAISKDGSRLFFTAQPQVCASSICGGELYVRNDRGTETTADDTTTQINVPETTACLAEPASCPPGTATYMDASANGSRVFFTTGQRMTNDAPAAASTNLYMWSANPDSEGHHLTLLSSDHEPADGSGQGDIRVAAVSEDGHYVYFVSGSQLVAGEPDFPEHALYVWHDETGVPRVEYIGSFADASDGQINTGQEWFKAFKSTARLSSDGRHLLFVAHSSSRLTGYDQVSGCIHGGFDSIDGCADLYLYSVGGSGPDGQRLQCASCRPDGLPAEADAIDESGSLEAGFAQSSPLVSRAVSSDGRFVFFSSPEALVPEDTNGTWDAYEFESETSEIHLLSSGTSDKPTFFVDASADGHDVFIATKQNLLGWDSGSERDLYDVRINGGFPEPAARHAICEGEVCQSSVLPRQAISPGSSAASGPGNLHPCRHGLVRRHGRCRKARRNHHRKHVTTKNRGGRR